MFPCPVGIPEKGIQGSPSTSNTKGDGLTIMDGADVSRKRSWPRQAEHTQRWKSAKVLSESESDSDKESPEEAWVYDDRDPKEESPQHLSADPGPSTKRRRKAPSGETSSTAALGPLDPTGVHLFCPEGIHHPHTAEWFPFKHIYQFLKHWIRKPLSKEACSKMRSECPPPPRCPMVSLKHLPWTPMWLPSCLRRPGVPGRG